MRKIGSFILYLLVAVLLVGLAFFVWMVYSDLFDEEAIQTVHTTENTITYVDDGSQISTTKSKKSLGETISDIFTSKPEQEVSYSEEKSSGKYFYEQLNQNQKIIYNGLQESKGNLVSGTYAIEFGNKFYDTLSLENGGDILGDDFQTAIEAFTHDNPDLFYINVSKMYLNMETTKRAFKTTYNVYIKPQDGTTYYADGFKSEAQVRNAIQRIEQVRDMIKSHLTGNTYKDIKIIHDYLVDNIEYDKNSKSIGKYTIYGALVDKKCVCEGYARSFKYLADSAGINCVLMQGKATNSDGTTENHAWNAVKLNGTWYLIDATWDDPIIVGRGIVLSSVHYKYFLKGERNFNKDHVLERQFTDKGKVFNFPTISVDDY